VVRFKVKNPRENGFKAGRRATLEIVSAIIAITQQPASFSQIMGHANLNYAQLREYLKFMIDRRLIEKYPTAGKEKRRMPVYQATEKGSRFLENYREGLILVYGEDFLENCSNLNRILNTNTRPRALSGEAEGRTARPKGKQNAS